MQKRKYVRWKETTISIGHMRGLMNTYPEAEATLSNIYMNTNFYLGMEKRVVGDEVEYRYFLCVRKSKGKLYQHKNFAKLIPFFKLLGGGF
jgi:hypothetical protein